MVWTRSLAGRVHGTRLPLRLLYLLTGAALTLSFLSVDLFVSSELWDREPVAFCRVLVVLVFLVPPTLLGLLPQLRHIEGAAASSLLGVDFRGYPPGLARTWDQRWRASAWFWAHLTIGGGAGFAVVAGAVWVTRLVRVLAGQPGESVPGLSWASAGGTWVSVGLVFLVLLVVLTVLAVLLACGHVLARLAPLLLGPSIAELLAELDSRTTHLVERTRLARELHDSVGHALTVVVLEAAVAQRRLPPDSHEVATSLATMKDTARHALEDLDAVLGLLREDRDAVLRQPVHDLESLDGLVRASRESGQPVTLECLVDNLATVPAVVSREAYRIVQEGVTNALRHAPDQPVHVRLARTEGRLLVQVTNPLAGGPVGAGATADAEAPDSGRGRRGLLGVRERVETLGGDVKTGARDGVWRLEVTLPLPRQEER